jgi:hypothetical protein
MTRAEYLALAERCEAATGPDDALDWAIAEAIGCAPGLPYSSSLDAAMTLVPEDAGRDAADERFRLESWTTSGVHAPHVRATAWVAGARRVYAATPALALCAASLRAMASKEDNGGE